MARRFAGLILGAALLLAGCGPRPPRTEGERLHRAKCGACHVRPDAGRFDRAGWEAVLDAHARRFPLTPDERRHLLRQLAPPEPRDDREAAPGDCSP